MHAENTNKLHGYKTSECIEYNVVLTLTRTFFDNDLNDKEKALWLRIHKFRYLIDWYSVFSGRRKTCRKMMKKSMKESRIRKGDLFLQELICGAH